MLSILYFVYFVSYCIIYMNLFYISYSEYSLNAYLICAFPMSWIAFQVTSHAAHIRCRWWWLGRIAGRGVKTQAMAWRGGVARSPICAWHLGFWVSWPLGICECRMVWGRGGAKTSTSRYQSEICDSLHLGDANVHFSVFVWGLHCYYFNDTCI